MTLHKVHVPHGGTFEKIKLFIKKNIVLIIALCTAAITSCIIPPDGKYIDYFDFKTLACLFSTLAVVCALRNIKFFTFLARKIVKCCKNSRYVILALVWITFIGSMLIANDMALLTFLPLGYFALESTGNQKYTAFTFIMQNISANLGGMLTPFGNPQNLYIFTKFNIPTGSFMLTMLLPFVLSVTAITVCCLFVKKEPLEIEDSDISLNKSRVVIYVVLFALAIVMVFRVIQYYIGMAVIILVLLFLDRDALKKVDYCLLLTFCAFFIFAGNMARMEAVKSFISSLLERNTLITTALSCQFISNVPTAILLSQFTENWRPLLQGVNIGGVGTLISSLASLITFREYTKHYPEKTGKYITLFSVFNFSFLILLLLVQSFFNML